MTEPIKAPVGPWRMSGQYGLDAETLEPGDWLEVRGSKDGRRWCQVKFAAPTSPDLDPCAMDVRVLWEGERKPVHYRIPRHQYHFRWAGKHRPTCQHCGKGWPCEQVQMQREMAAQLVEDMHRCVVCGKTGGSGLTVSRETPDGRVGAFYHYAKSRRTCRAELIRVASESDLRILRSMGVSS